MTSPMLLAREGAGLLLGRAWSLGSVLEGETGGGEENEISQMFLAYSPAIWGGLLLILFSLYLNLYLDKYFRELQIRGSTYVDDETFEFAAAGVKGFMTGMTLIILFFLEFWSLPDSEGADYYRSFWEELIPFLGIIVLLPLVFFLFRMLVMLLHGFIKARAPEPEEGETISKGISVGELLLKYTLYLVAVIIAYILLLGPIGQEERLTNIQASIWEHSNELVLLLVLGLLFYIGDQIIFPSIIEDFKKRGYSPQMMEVIQWAGRAAIRGVFILFLLYTSLAVFGLENIADIFVAFLFLIIIVAVAVTLASPLRNLLSGLVIISNRPFDVGDRVRIMGEMDCVIQKQTLLFTHVRTLDGQPLLLPNEKILTHPIINLSKMPTRLLTLEMDFHSSIPNKRIKGLLVKSAFALKDVDRKKAPKVSVTSIRGDLLTYQLAIGVSKGRSVPDTRSKLLCKIQDELLEAGISEPLSPQGEAGGRIRGRSGGRGPRKPVKGMKY